MCLDALLEGKPGPVEGTLDETTQVGEWLRCIERGIDVGVPCT